MASNYSILSLALLFFTITTTLLPCNAQRNTTTLNIQEIGASFWPPSVNLLEELTGGSTVYTSQSISDCLLEQDISETPSSFVFYENNNAIYNSIGGSLGVNVKFAVASIAATLASVTDITLTTTTVQGTSLNYGQYVRSYDLPLDCLARQNFDQDFIDAILELPPTINNTQSLSSYESYRQFASIYGGFVVTRIVLGARAQFFALAEESRRYTELQFNSRICATITVEGVNIGPCIGFNLDQIRESLTLLMSTSKYLRGGNRTLQAKLSTEGLNASTLLGFIQSASTNPYPVDYNMEPVWELYNGNDMQIRTRLNNLRDYFSLLSNDNNQGSGASTVHYIVSFGTILLIAILTTMSMM